LLVHEADSKPEAKSVEKDEDKDVLGEQGDEDVIF